MSKALKEIVERAETWPKRAQDELVRAAEDIERSYVRGATGGPRLRVPSPEERARAWEELEQLTSRVRDLAPEAGEDVAAEEQRIADEITEMRRSRRLWLRSS